MTKPALRPYVSAIRTETESEAALQSSNVTSRGEAIKVRSGVAACFLAAEDGMEEEKRKLGKRMEEQPELFA